MGRLRAAAVLLLCASVHAVSKDSATERLDVDLAAGDPKTRTAYADGAGTKVAQSKASNSKLGESIQTTCKQEIDALGATIAEAQKLSAQDIGEQKQKLSQALEQRVNGLDALIAALKKFQLQLKDHVERTNTVYDKRYQQYTEDMKTSSALLNDLGLMVAEPSKPGFKKITLANYAKYAAAGASASGSSTAASSGTSAESATANATDLSAEGAAPPTGLQAALAARNAAASNAQEAAAAAATASSAAGAAGGAARFKGVRGSLLEVRSQQMAKIDLTKVGSFKELMSLSEGQGQSPAACTAAWDATFSMYKTAHDHHYVNDGVFEKERIALNRYLKLLDELINHKRDKRNKLDAQLKQVKALMNLPEDDIAKRVTNALKEHEALIKDACPKMASMNENSAKAKDAVLSKIKECSKANFGRSADPHSAAAATDAGATATHPAAVDAPADGPTMVSGTITHVPGESGTAKEQPMDVVKPTQGTVALPHEK